MPNINETERQIFDGLRSSLTGDSSEIDVDTATANCNLARNQIIDLFRKFESNGNGRLVIGRHKHKTRFVFNQSGDGLPPPRRVLPIAEARQNPELVDYPFFIRPSLKASFQLPSDLSSVEADRIATFIKALAIEKQPSESAE